MKRADIKDLVRKIFRGIRSYRHPILKLFGGLLVFLIIINAAYYFASEYSPGVLNGVMLL